MTLFSRIALVRHLFGIGCGRGVLLRVPFAIDAHEFLVGRITIMNVRKQRLGREKSEAQHEDERDKAAEHGGGSATYG